MVLKLLFRADSHSRLVPSQSNRSGFETSKRPLGVRGHPLSQSNRSGFETNNHISNQHQHQRLNPTVVVLKQSIEGASAIEGICLNPTVVVLKLCLSVVI